MTVLAVLALGMAYMPSAVAQVSSQPCPTGVESMSTQEACYVEIGSATSASLSSILNWRIPPNVDPAHVVVSPTDSRRMFYDDENFAKGGSAYNEANLVQGTGIGITTSPNFPLRAGSGDWNPFSRGYITEDGGTGKDGIYWPDHNIPTGWSAQWYDTTVGAAASVQPSDIASISVVEIADAPNRVYIYPKDGRLCHHKLGVFRGTYASSVSYSANDTGVYRMCLQARIQINDGNNYPNVWIRDNHNGPTSLPWGGSGAAPAVQDPPETTNTWHSDSGCTQQGSTQKGNYLLICWPGTSVGVGMTDPYVSGHALDCFTNGTCREYPSGAWTWQSSGDYTPTPPNDCYVPAQTLEHGQTITCHNGSIS